jgi:protoheme ferro-lyase
MTKATEVMLFPLYPQHAMASTTTILELLKNTDKNISHEIHNRSCILQQT